MCLPLSAKCLVLLQTACVSITSGGFQGTYRFLWLCAPPFSRVPLPSTSPLWVAVGIKWVSMVAASQYCPWRQHRAMEERENLQQSWVRGRVNRRLSWGLSKQGPSALESDSLTLDFFILIKFKKILKNHTF